LYRICSVSGGIELRPEQLPLVDALLVVSDPLPALLLSMVYDFAVDAEFAIP